MCLLAVVSLESLKAKAETLICNVVLINISFSSKYQNILTAMKPQTILFFGVLLILFVYTTSILAGHEAFQESHDARGGAPPKKVLPKKSPPPKKAPPKQTPPKQAPPKKQPTTKAPATKPTTKPPATKPTKTPATKPPAAKPATKQVVPLKLCNFNKLVMVPGSSVHKFTVKNAQDTKYSSADFEVSWKAGAPKTQSFFKWVGSKMQFASAISTMKCQKANVNDFGRICKVDQDLQKTYDVAFGDYDINKCTIPDGHFVISVRFVLSLSNFKTSPGGKWSVFTGLFKANSEAQAKNIVSTKVKEIVQQIRTTKLNTFDINYNLNIIPEFVKGTLTWVFNSNINSDFVKNIQQDQPYDLTDIGYIKVLRPGSEFIIGNIDEGNQAVKQICETAAFDDTNDCKVPVQ